ncbi:MAG: acyltransferase [Bacteroidota bacterium]
MANYIKSLDGLRGIAVLLVIIYHFSKLPFIGFDFELGWIGVQLFFVLSGFLITKILIQEKKETLNFYLKRFYWRRTLRIFPIYFLYLLLIYVIWLLSHEPNDFKFSIPYLLTYTYNFSVLAESWEITRLYSHLWSLSIEEQFYLLWPIIVYVLSIRGLKILAITIIILTPFVRLILGEILINTMATEELAGIGVYWFTLSHFDAFAVGGVLNIIHENTRHKIIRFGWIVWLMVLTAGILNLVNYDAELTSYEWTSLGYLLPVLENYQHVWSYTLLNLLFGIMILSASLKKTTPFLEVKPLVFMGKISYGMYLYHFIIIVFVEKLFTDRNINGLLLLFITLGVITLVSYLSYIIFEKKFLVLKNKKFNKMPSNIT